MSRSVGILQPGYLPWLGYFEQMHRVDVFVSLDDVQFTKNDWRNRNRILGPDGVQWLTVPVKTKGLGVQRIDQVAIAEDGRWRRKHRESIRSAYRAAPHATTLNDAFSDIYEQPWERLLDIDRALIEALRALLGIDTEMLSSTTLELDEHDDPNERLAQICERVGADRFYEGASGRDYMDLSIFERGGIEVQFQDYAHPTYRQSGDAGPFVPYLSVVDLLAMHGPASLDILAGVGKPQT